MCATKSENAYFRKLNTCLKVNKKGKTDWAGLVVNGNQTWATELESYFPRLLSYKHEASATSLLNGTVAGTQFLESECCWRWTRSTLPSEEVPCRVTLTIG